MSVFTKIQKHPFAIVIIFMIIFVGLALYSDVDQFSNTLIEIDYRFIPLILVPMTAHLFLLGVRFHLLIRALNISISLKKSVLIYLAGLSLVVTPLGVGQIIKSHIIKKEFGDAISKTAPVILIEKWNELVSVILILIFLTLLNQIIETQIIIVLGIIISIILIGIMRSNSLFSIFKKLLKKIKIFKNFEEIIENSEGTLKTLSSPKNIVEGLVLTVPAKLLEALAVFIAFHALSIQFDFIISTQIFFTAIISGIISFIPGGLIATEGSMLGLITKYGSDFTIAATAVIFIRLVTIWYATFLGFITTKFLIKN